jgi:hypothetical protein
MATMSTPQGTRMIHRHRILIIHYYPVSIVKEGIRTEHSVTSTTTCLLFRSFARNGKLQKRIGNLLRCVCVCVFVLFVRGRFVSKSMPVRQLSCQRKRVACHRRRRRPSSPYDARRPIFLTRR